MHDTSNVHPAPTPLEVARARRRTSVALAAWVALAAALAGSGALRDAPPIAIPVLIWGVVLTLVGLYLRAPAFRAWTHALDLRGAILFHVVRVFYGAAFLLLAARGAMPAEFANVAGPGDIAAGLTAIGAAVAASRPGETRRRIVLAWSALGLADMIVVIVTAQRLIFLHPERGLREAFVGYTAFALLPGLVVPMIIATQLLVFARLARRGAHAVPTHA